MAEGDEQGLQQQTRSERSPELRQSFTSCRECGRPLRPCQLAHGRQLSSARCSSACRLILQLDETQAAHYHDKAVTHEKAHMQDQEGCLTAQPHQAQHHQVSRSATRARHLPNAFISSGSNMKLAVWVTAQQIQVQQHLLTRPADWQKAHAQISSSSSTN
jgi:hypothetical protein